MRRPISGIIRRITQIVLEEYDRYATNGRDQLEKDIRHSIHEIQKEVEKKFIDHRFHLSLLRGRHLGKRCFVVGNGPSLNADDLDKIKNEYSFASNKINLIFDQTKWRPTYYSVEDPLLLKSEEENIKNLDCALKLFPNSSLYHMDRDLNALYFNFTYPKVVREPLSNPDFPGFSRDISKQVFWGSTITYTLIQLAVYMGFKEIYLLGVDHSYSLPKTMDGRVYVSEGEVNHFHKNYRKIGERWHSPNLHVLEHSYETAKQVCESMDVKIFNASRKTKLSIFDCIDLDTLFTG